MKMKRQLLGTSKTAIVLCAVFAMGSPPTHATGSDAALCANLTEEECKLSMQDKQPLSPVPALFKFQARVAQAKMPLPNAEFEQVFVKVLQGASDVLCVEQFRKVQVRDSVLNLEIGRNMSCDLGPTIAQNSDLQPKFVWVAKETVLSQSLLVRRHTPFSPVIVSGLRTPPMPISPHKLITLTASPLIVICL